MYVPWNRSSPFPHPFIIHSHPEWYRRIVMLLGFLMPGASQHNGRPEQKLWIIKRPQLLVEFPYIQPSNLKSVERRKSNLKKYWFCRPICGPFHSAARDSRITPPPPPHPPPPPQTPPTPSLQQRFCRYIRLLNSFCPVVSVITTWLNVEELNITHREGIFYLNLIHRINYFFLNIFAWINFSIVIWRVLWDEGPTSGSPGKGWTKMLLETNQVGTSNSFIISDSSFLNFNIVHYVLNSFKNALPWDDHLVHFYLIKYIWGESPSNRFHTRYDAGRVGDQNLLLRLKIDVKVSSHWAWKAD